MTTHAFGTTTTPQLLRIAEDELQQLRGRLALVARFIHDPTHDLSARQALARLLNLPHPAAPGRAPTTTANPDTAPAGRSAPELTLPSSRNDSESVLTTEGTR
ncbi:hypothetical protein ACFYXC_36435 [Streptomyces sp. NPDC002701]|uniref:hypothetical protein n=1 Tax=Streptomyces sp. NPDC002701 TaxID=3364661 RepID=UPI0036B6487D